MRDVVTITRKEAKERGLKRYFTGEPCPKGHVAERLVSSRGCIVCGGIKNMDWRADNKDKITTTSAAWRAKNQERRRLAGVVWRANNKERKAATSAAWRAKNQERATATDIAWYIKNKKRASIKNAAWRANNKERRLVTHHRRRARKCSVSGSHTAAEIKDLLHKQDYCCASPHCNADLRVVKRHLDHIIPLSRPKLGPTNSISNLQWLCEPCNVSKGNKTMEEWVSWLGVFKMVRTAK